MKKLIIVILLMSIVTGGLFAGGFFGGVLFVSNDTFEEDDSETSIDQFGFALSGSHYVGKGSGIGFGYSLGVGFPTVSYDAGIFGWEVESDPFSLNASVAAQYLVSLNEAAYLEFGVGLGYLGVASTYTFLGEEYIASLNIVKLEMKTGGMFSISDSLNIGAGAVFSFPLDITGTIDTSSEETPPSIDFDSGFGIKGYLGTYLKY
ncbi:MAG: hypothetical protein VB025_12925 [Sphaerochaeta sp.]|nr:hypothetical protein [Sphaerochaeta sp.]